MSRSSVGRVPAAKDILTAACSYAGFRHQRKIVFHKSDLRIVILDRVEGSPGEHRIEQFWHFGEKVHQRSPRCFQVGTRALIVFEDAADPRLIEGQEYGWISPALGRKEPAPMICIEQRVTLPASLATLIDLSGEALSGDARTIGFRLNPDESDAMMFEG